MQHSNDRRGEMPFPTFKKWGTSIKNGVKNNAMRLTAGVLAIYGVTTVVWLWRYITGELKLGKLGNLSYILYIHPIIIGAMLWVAIGAYWLCYGAFQLWRKKIRGMQISIGGLLWMIIPSFIVSLTYAKNTLYQVRPNNSLRFNYHTLIPWAWVVFNIALYLVLAVLGKRLRSTDGSETTPSKTIKKFALVGLLTLVTVLGYFYYWSKHSPLFAYKNRSDENIICEKKCQIAASESLKKCGKDCWDGVPIYGFNKINNVCIMRSNLTGPDYIDFYVKDCNTNQYLERWNFSKTKLPEEISWPQIGNQVIMKMEEHNRVVERLMGKEGETFLLGY